MHDAHVVEIAAQVSNGALSARYTIYGDGVLSRNALSTVFPVTDVAARAQAQKPS